MSSKFVMSDDRLEFIRNKIRDYLEWLDLADAKGLTERDANDLKNEDVFQMFDKDGSGSICVSELGKVMRCIGLDRTEAELAEIMKKFDLDQSGTLSYEEYAAIIDNCRITPSEVEVQLREAFLVFDRDKSGSLDKSELQEVLCQMGEPLNQREIDFVLNKMDVDKDGKISVNEFVTFLCKKV